MHAFARKVVKVVSSFAKNGRYDADEEETEEDLVNPSPLSWHKNCKTTFGIANNSEKGTKISVFDRRRSVMEILEQMSSSGGTVPSAPFSSVGVESDQEKRRCCAREFTFRAVFGRAWRTRRAVWRWLPDHPNEIAMTTKESGGVRLFSKVLSSFASNNNNNNSSASDVTTWKIERLPNDETETLLDSGGVGRDRLQRILDKLAWSPDGSLLATASSRGSTIRIWDVNAKKSTAMSSGNMSGLSSVIRSIKRRKTFRVPKSKSEIMKAFSSIDSFKETLVPIEIDTKRNGIISLAFSGSGRHLASVSKDGALTIWTKKSGVWSENGFSSTGKVTAFAWGPSPKAAARRGNKRVREYDENEIGLCCVETAIGGVASKSTDKRHISCWLYKCPRRATSGAAHHLSKIPGEGDSSKAAAITSCAWDDTASRLVFGHADGKVRVYATIVHPVLTVRAIGTFCREKEDEEDGSRMTKREINRSESYRRFYAILVR